MRYYRPTNTTDAIAALAAEPHTARVIVGGTDLLVALRHGKAEPSLLVDIKAVADLRPPIEVDEAGITFGPTATMTAVAAHPAVRDLLPGLVEAALLVGSVAIRNRASLIANSANGSPAADTAPPLLAMDAEVSIASVAGERVVKLRDFFIGPRRTKCGPGEMVTAIRVPRPSVGSSSAFERMTRRRGVDLATCSAGVVVAPDGTVTAGLGAVGPVTLLGGPVGPVDFASEAAIDDALDELLKPATPISDVRAGQPYRAAMLRVLTKRAILRAAANRTPSPAPSPAAPSSPREVS